MISPTRIAARDRGGLLADVLRQAQGVGPRIHDARIAALCRQHAVTELWTADRAFSRFSGFATRNPLV